MAGIAWRGPIITTADSVAELDAELVARSGQADLNRVDGKRVY